MRKLAFAVRAALVGIVMAAGLTVVAQAPAQAAESCSGNVCIDAWRRTDGTYGYRVKYRQLSSPDYTIWGHADITGPRLQTKIPVNGDTSWPHNVYTPNQYGPWGSGTVCARLWKWTGGRYVDVGRACRWV